MWLGFTVLLCILCTITSASSYNGARVHTKELFNVSGLMSAVFTPMNANKSIANIQAIPFYADLLDSMMRIEAILVGGTSGEFMGLSLSDKKKVVDAWVAENKSFHIQVQVGGAAYADVIELTKHCSNAPMNGGVHSILTLPDLYTKPKTVEELVSYVESVSLAAPNLPIFYYHIPKHTDVTISMPDFVKAATNKILNFKGIKFTSNDLAEAAKVLKVLKGDQQLLFGGEDLIAPAALLGVKTFVSPAANLVPELLRSIIEAINISDVKRARKEQNILSELVAAISAEGGRIPAMKEVLEYQTGINMGPPVLPRKPITEEQMRNLEAKLKQFGLD